MPLLLKHCLCQVLLSSLWEWQVPMLRPSSEMEESTHESSVGSPHLPAQAGTSRTLSHYFEAYKQPPRIHLALGSASVHLKMKCSQTVNHGSWTRCR